MEKTRYGSWRKKRSRSSVDWILSLIDYCRTPIAQKHGSLLGVVIIKSAVWPIKEEMARGVKGCGAFKWNSERHHKRIPFAFVPTINDLKVLFTARYSSLASISLV